MQGLENSDCGLRSHLFQCTLSSCLRVFSSLHCSFRPFGTPLKSSSNNDLGAVSDVRTHIFAWLVGVKARFFFYHTHRSYGMVIGDDFLGGVVRVLSGDTDRTLLKTLLPNSLMSVSGFDLPRSSSSPSKASTTEPSAETASSRCCRGSRRRG